MHTTAADLKLMDTLEPQHTMRAVVRQTGLTPGVIRIWEKRYNAITPGRTASGQRVFSDQDVERLQLLRRATLAGHGIGRVANLPVQRLQELVDQSATTIEELTGYDDHAFFAQSYVERCLSAIERLDAEDLENTLARATVHLGQPALMEDVIEPLMAGIDRRWESGTFRIAHEHLASAIIRVFLGSLVRHARTVVGAPSMMVTTPVQQVHEIGALMTAATAAHEGWKATYLGPNLPAAEIALVAEANQAAVIALSIVYPADDQTLLEELRQLGRLLGNLPQRPELLVGGRGAAYYAPTLDEIGAVRIADMHGLRLKLQQLRGALAPSGAVR